MDFKEVSRHAGLEKKYIQYLCRNYNINENDIDTTALLTKIKSKKNNSYKRNLLALRLRDL